MKLYGLRVQWWIQDYRLPFLHPLTVLNGQILRLTYFLVGVAQSQQMELYGSLEGLEQIAWHIPMMVLTGLRRLLGMRCLHLTVSQSLGTAQNGSLVAREQISWRIRPMG
jgi:hypothetical protein